MAGVKCSKWTERGGMGLIGNVLTPWRLIWLARQGNDAATKQEDGAFTDLGNGAAISSGSTSLPSINIDQVRACQSTHRAPNFVRFK